MRVFILCTGRCGSTTFTNACKYIENYTSSHESLAKAFGRDRFRYQDNHIESDNRLSWHLGQLNEIYKDDAFYVHLKRNRDKVAASWMKRFYQPISIIDSFCGGIRKTPPELLNQENRLRACYDYIDTVNANIEYFISNKSNTLTINLEKITKDFPIFWDKIGAKGDLNKALRTFEMRHNKSSKRRINFSYRIKLLLKREWQHITMCLKQ